MQIPYNVVPYIERVSHEEVICLMVILICAEDTVKDTRTYLITLVVISTPRNHL